MDQAASIWKMLDDMAESNPEQYKQFMQEQMSGMGGNGAKQKVSEIPTESFCVRMRLEGGAALFVNVCSHSRIKPPTAEESGTVSVAIGVPRAVEEPKKKKKQQQSIETGAPPKKPLIEVVDASDATEETPTYDLSCDDDARALRLVVPLPRVSGVGDLDLEMGEAAVALRAEGVYKLDVTLPKPVLADDAKCKFDKKRRVLTLTMPLA